MKLPRTIIKNLIILALSASLVFVTQVARHALAEDPPSLDNKYTSLFFGGDFDVDCEQAQAENAEAADEQTADLGKTGTAIKKYHEVINCLFNKRIKMLVEKMLKTGEENERLTPEDLEKIHQLLSPGEPVFDENGQQVGRKKCQGEGEDINLSTYCLAQAATEEYFEFRTAMQEARRIAHIEAAQKKFELESAGREEGEDELHGEFFGLGDVSGLSRALRGLGAELNRIDREIELSRQALDQALSAYNELQMALPLHRKYVEAIKALEKYRNKVSDIRQEVDLYPVTFLDVTTTQCT